MEPNRPKILLTVIGAVLLLGLGFQLFRPRAVIGEASVRGKLLQRLPRDVAGWRSRDLPLGETEVVRDQTASLLRYDDYVYREFGKADKRFTVYVSYWRPGKMPTRLIVVHTPDRCWIENGWTCSEASFNERIVLGSEPQSGVQRRVFSPPGARAREYVLYWMNVGGRAYDFGTGLAASSKPLKWWGNFIDEMRHEQGEQLFVRLTSDRPLEELRGDPGVEQVLAAIGELTKGSRG